jgi:hypothetical protein
MERDKLLLLPFFAGLILMGYSWCISYPLSVNSVDDFVFNHVSVLYWVSARDTVYRLKEASLTRLLLHALE